MPKIECSHCSLAFDEAQMIKEETDDGTGLYFCCNGCQGVYHLLQEEGLDNFYEIKGNTQLHPAKGADEDLSTFDSEGFQKRYIKVHDDGLFEVNLVMEHIHCSACIWLNEKVLHRKEGIIEASLNFSTHKAKIVFDPNKIKLSEIITTIRSIGYDAHPYDPSLHEERMKKERREYYMRILVAIFGMMNIMWLSIANYAGYFSGIDEHHKLILHIAEFVLATPVLFYSGWIFFRGAYYGLKNGMVNMDFLVASGALSAYIYSDYALITGGKEVYFDSVVMIITFILVGKYLEVLGKKQATDTMDALLSTLPTEVTVIENEQRKRKSIDSVEVGEIIELKAGEKSVIDGVITLGECSFDESSVTGESTPVLKKSEDRVLSGSICLDGVVRYKATKSANDSLIYKIASILEDAMSKKPHIETLANRISGHFSTAILILAILTFAGWYFYTQSVEQALIIGISVIVIACPCALGLATPVATLVGLFVAIKRQILFKEAALLETMAKATLFAFDKTGTLTEGKPEVVNALIYQNFDKEAVVALLSHSNHPVAKGVMAHLDSAPKKEMAIVFRQINEVSAKGIVGISHEGDQIVAGNGLFMQELGVDMPYRPSKTHLFIALNQKIVALYELEDRLRSDAKEAIAKLKDNGVKVVMLTGDSMEAAQKVAKEVCIEEVYHSLLPTDKAKLIEAYRSKGEVVVMVGDGINDSLALSKSNIAIAMGSGADISLGVSDVVLLDEKISKIYEAYRIGLKTYKTIKENLALSLAYNMLALPLAMAGFVNPLIAALSMSLSSLLVVANSLRIKKIRFKR